MAIDSTLPAASVAGRLRRRLKRRLLRVVDHPSLDGEVLDAVRSSSPEILWCDKVDCIRPETFEEARRLRPGLRIVGFIGSYEDERAGSIAALGRAGFSVKVWGNGWPEYERRMPPGVEIPACGKFTLAERSEEHCALFREGIEAEFFADDQELLEKTRYYLDHPEEREKIAAAGHKRCIESGHSHHERLRSMLTLVDTLG
ncbi:MAG: glycosyltransferase family 1 protein [Deltaproteobacteria bacterium]|nr:glycosyltransferase family 1 protein [Deltaproteobacteria bacterium]